MLLEGQVALVTGAGREQKGIGRAISLMLAAEGASVAVVSRTVANAESVATAVQAAGGKAIALGVDVTSLEQVEAAVKQTIETFGRLDILVSNAGITRDNLLIKMSPSDWDQVIQTNLSGAFYSTRAVTRQMMRQKHGRIIYISSVVGIQGNVGQANYAAAKAGLIGLAKSTARELGSRGITANVVAPGFVDTAMTDSLPDDARKDIASRIPLERFGSAEDIAGAVLYLSGPHGGYVTGEVIRVDGGLAM
jgi:3-oxoacyl-[acyl-carrier protein] reductase